VFNNKFLYQGAKNFMAYFYLPANMVLMSFYAVDMICEAIPG
jgi:hypothetical protein